MLEASPLFSIIIPTYNQTEYVVESIQYLLLQTYLDFEIIISDDSDNDLTALAIDKITDSRLKYYRNVPGLGRVLNYRISLLERCKGSWSIICDGDDFIYDKNYLKDVKTIIDQHLNLVLIQAGHIKGESLLYGNIEVPSIPADEACISGFEYLVRFREFSHFSHLSTVANIRLLRMLDPFRLDILSADIETYLRLAVYGDVYLIKRPVGLWRQHGSNASVLANYLLLLQNLKWIDSVHNYWLSKATADQVKIIRKLKYLRLRNGIFTRLNHLFQNDAEWSHFFSTLKNIFLEKEFCRAIILERKFYKLCSVYLRQKLL